MSFTFAPDFVITKRRKRNFEPVDPYLGFYANLSCSQSVVQDARSALSPHANTGPAYNPTVNVQHVAEAVLTTRLLARPAEVVVGVADDDNRVTPHADKNRSPHHANEAEAVTVEQFLREAASPVTKRYTQQRARKRRRQEHAHPNSQDSYRPSSDVLEGSDHPDLDSSSGPPRKRRKDIRWSSDEAEHPDNPRPPAERRRRPLKKVQTLTARLLLAGAATGVDIVGVPLMPESKTHTAARRPLPLVPDHRLPSPPAVSKINRRQYVDPRKVHPMSRTSFQFAPVAEEVSATTGKREARPVTEWKPSRAQLVYDTPCIGRPKATPRAEERLVSIPLVLAPERGSGIEDRKSPCIQKPLHPAKANRKPRDTSSPHAVIPFQPFVPPSPKRPAPLSAIGLSLCATSLARLSTPLLGPSEDPTRDILTSPLRSSSPHGDARACCSSACSAASAKADMSLHAPPPSDVPRYPFDSVLEHDANTSGLAKPPTWGDSDKTPAHVQHTSPAETPGVGPLASLRPMKSLGSLLDSFREIARTATQVSRTSDSKRPRPRPCTTQSIHMRSSLLELDAVPLEAPSSSLTSSSYRKTRARPTGLAAAPSLSILRLQDRIKRATQKSPANARMDTPRGIHTDHHTGSVPLEDSTRGSPSYTCAAPTKGTIDVLAALQNRGRNILHLPSSPLPGWSVLSLESSNMLAEHQSSEG